MNTPHSPHSQHATNSAGASSAPKSTPLPFAQMLRLSRLNALGMLDEPERRAYEATFRVLPGPQADRLRELESRYADLSHLLPEVSPVASLRERTLDAVEDEASAELDVLARLAPAQHVKTRGVHQVWRVAALCSTAAAIAFGVFMFQTSHEVTRLYSAAEQQRITDYVRNVYGTSFMADLSSAKLRLVQLDAPVDSPNAPSARVFANPASGYATLVVSNMPLDFERYQLVATGADGSSRVVHTFTATGGRATLRFKWEVSPGERIAIVPVGPADARPLVEGIIASG